MLTDARDVVVVKLKLLGLTIPEESGIVQMDAMMRADLIDLMARILMEVASMRSGSQQCVIVAQGSALSRPIPGFKSHRDAEIQCMFWCMFACDITAFYCDILQNPTDGHVFHSVNVLPIHALTCGLLQHSKIWTQNPPALAAMGVRPPLPAPTK
jgi:hypothetical protein